MRNRCLDLQAALPNLMRQWYCIHHNAPPSCQQEVCNVSGSGGPYDAIASSALASSEPMKSELAILAPQSDRGPVDSYSY